MDVRLNKYLSDAGFCTRREADQVIADGRVTINDRPAKMGDKVKSLDIVKIDGELLKSNLGPIAILLNKPSGIAINFDPDQDQNLLDCINYPSQLFPIASGMDREAEGLLLLTNNRNLAAALTRAENEAEKEYIISVENELPDSALKQLAAGVQSGGHRSTKCLTKRLSLYQFSLLQKSDTTKQLRRACEECGLKVPRLVRMRVGAIRLNIPLGDWKLLSGKEVDSLIKGTAPKASAEKKEGHQGTRFESLSDDAKKKYGVSPALNPKSKAARELNKKKKAAPPTKGKPAPSQGKQAPSKSKPASFSKGKSGKQR